VALTLDDLRRDAATRSMFAPTTLQRALDRFGFVQADPIRAPARAQDLILRHRVRNYRAGDLERRYQSLDVDEGFFINYGFVSPPVDDLMHPRGGPVPWSRSAAQHVQKLLDFVRSRGAVHPREVDRHFSHGAVTNYWGGSSSATTHLLEAMHYRGLLRVVRRERGIRVYAVRDTEPTPSGRQRDAALDGLVDTVVGLYAPLPRASLSFVVRRLRYAAPQWRNSLPAALRRAQQRLAQTTLDGVTWFWPHEQPEAHDVPARLRLLAPFDPVVWDRRRFALLWGWEYRFEAYTPVNQRQRGYYALPLLWRNRVIGWANAAVKEARLEMNFGYASGSAPREPAFRRALEQEIVALHQFLALTARTLRASEHDDRCTLRRSPDAP